MPIPSISIDIWGWIEMMAESPWKAAWVLFYSGGWVLVVVVAILGGWHIWLMKRRIKFARMQKYVLLTVNLPKQTEQSPKAVENIFSHLAGLYRGLTMKEMYWEGQFQTTLSLELVSIDGYIRYYIRVNERFRDLVEATIFAQYPDAEIIETTDYTQNVPRYFPDENYDMWGTEFVLRKSYAYPIKTYPQFEHGPSREYFKDPLASMLEFLSKLRKGEQIWLQILIQPTTNDWKKTCEAEIEKFTAKFKGKSVTGEPSLGMFAMTPGERATLEAMQIKMSKVGFWTKIRFIYIAEKGVFRKGPIIGSMSGALQQYGGLNEFKKCGPVSPKADYFWQKNKFFEYITFTFYKTYHTRQNRIMKNYINRDMWGGGPMYILNTEELATLYHFPMTEIKAPLVKKTEAKKAEPPFSLPTG